jgi:tetratricopeptide (TPR) repeat protein
LRSKVELGKINKLSKAFPEAIAEFNNVIALDPNYGPAYRELAETYFGWAWTSQKEYAGRIQQAVQFYEKYMDLTDRSLDSRLRHADFLFLAKDFKLLEAEAIEMAKLDKVNPRVLRYLAY